MKRLLPDGDDGATLRRSVVRLKPDTTYRDVT